MEKLALYTQENVIALLCFNSDYYLLVRNSITPQLFDYPYNKIIERIVDYIDTYKSVPGDHTADVLEPYLSGPDGDKYQDALKSLLLFEKSNPNYKYILDRINQIHKD